MHRTARLTLCSIVLLAAAALPAAQRDRSRTEAELRTVNERIERLQRQVQKDMVEKDRASRELRDAEQSVARVHGDLARLRDQRAERSAERERLEAELARRRSEQERAQHDLASQVRSAYLMGRSEPVKLLLNQRNPADFSRNFTYYGYFGRLRARQIEEISANMSLMADIAAKIDVEDGRLAALEAQRQARLSELESARKERGRVLANLDKESRNRTASLQRMQRQQQQLEKLLKELSKATESTPFDPNDPFAKLRGKLAWPVSGRLVVEYGAAISGGLRADGIEIDTDRGSNVRAVHEGRVIYSDWLQGRGLLLILDHGNGYWSLYGHNEQLFKPVGATVQAGDAIAAAGDTGGRRNPGLYFQLRRAGKAVNPAGWFRSAAPPER
jgi:murein hydrolase activator